MLPSFDPEPGNGLAQLRDRMVALVLAALVGACAAVAAVAFFRLIAAASALWAQPLPRSLAEAGGGVSAAG
ncbi:MAG: hypothetical protein ACO2ZK_04890, partial [Gemmobacter sp.]